MEYTTPMVHLLRQSVGNAWRGLTFVWNGERNFRLEVASAVFVLLVAMLLHFTYVEFCIVVACIAGVLTAEVINTIVEELLDIIAPSYSEHVRRLKDATAGAVLLLSLASLAAGIATVVHHFML